jgi:ABC-type transport system involved in multi-copper enzyme maturation permease subunit
MEAILAISEITFKKVKEPAYSLLFLVAAVIGYFVSGMEVLSFQDSDATISAIISLKHGTPLLSGFVIIFIMTMLIAIFSGATDIPRDIESRMIMLILVKPVNRGEYLLGKYIGIVVLCLGFFLLASTTAVIAHFITEGKFYGFSILCRQLYLVLGIFPFVAMTMMISTFLSDIGAMIVTAIYLMFSISMSAMSIFVDMLPKSLGVASYVHIMAYFFPNFFYFFNSFRLIGLVSFSLLLYSLALTALFLMIAVIRLNNRDVI